MGMVKFGVVGLLIMMPFIFIGSFRSEEAYHKLKTKQYMEQQIEEALSDAAFALKTYSQSYYDAEESYAIEIPYDQVIDVFFSSLDHRGFSYSKSDFPVMLFVGYDSIRSYSPEKEAFSIDYPYFIADSMSCDYFTLGDLIDSALDQETRVMYQKRLSGMLEANINQTIHQSRLSGQLGVMLPEVEDGYHLFIDDLSILIVYSGSQYSGLGLTEYVDLKPSGIMKMQEIITY